MYKLTLLVFLAAWMPHIALGQSTKLYDDTRVHSIYMTLPADSLQLMIDETIHDRYMRAQFVFDDGVVRDTLPDVGLRLRGNTSLAAQKKSFKVSFNEYVPGRKYQGVKKLNLRGSHNDPSLIREKLWFTIAERAGDPERRASFVRLYINGAYRGAYTNLEEVDKEWLERAYQVDTGNLYKCTWPADLAYLGPLQGSYTSIMNTPTDRAYDLVTNEAQNDYTDLVKLMRILNRPVTVAWATDSIASVLNVESALRGFAINVATGHWDDYFYNKNNYYLYHNPSTGFFEFFSFDADNTMGVDWLNRDWSTRNALTWHKGDQPRPLATQLLAVPAFKQRYVDILDSITCFITHPDSINADIMRYHSLITSAAIADTYRTLDYGYTTSQFFNSITQTIDGHTPWGIKPFFERRHSNTKSQIGPLDAEIPSESGLYRLLYPNPAVFEVHLPVAQCRVEVVDMRGAVLMRTQVSDGRLVVAELASGLYFVRMRTNSGVVYTCKLVRE
jgi:CotH kinase protein/Secretion system C-terminal sorting domain